MHECDATFSVKRVTFEQVKLKVCKAIQEHIHDIEGITQRRKHEWDRIRKEIDKEEREISKLIELSMLVEVKEIADKIKEKQAGRGLTPSSPYPC